MIQFMFIMITLLMFLLIYMYTQAKRISLVERDFQIDDWPEGFNGVRFLFISDIHREVIPEQLKEELRNKKIDLVLIGGDITEKNVPLERVRKNIQYLASLAPSYFVWGNHDYKTDYRQLDHLLREEGVHVLDNRAVSFESGDDKLWLIGVDDCTTFRDRLDLALLDVVDDGYRLLLSHSPMIVQKISEDQRIGAILSGHTHGGQISFPFVGPLIMQHPLYRKYLSGEYTVNNGRTKLFVSNGMGTSRIPIRLGAPAEVYLFTFKAPS